MNNKILIAICGAALLLTGACTVTTTNSNANSNANKPANSNTANTNSATPAANTNTASAPANTTEGKQDFTLVNATGVEIDSLYVSPHDANEWGEDILGQDTLADGQKVDIKFHRNEKAAMWDLKIQDKAGASIEWSNLNLMEISKVTLHLKDGKGTAETE